MMGSSLNNLMVLLADATDAGEFRLPVCQSCGNTMYPPRERCSSCLADTIRLDVVDNAATVLATTSIRHSLEPFFSQKLPWRIALVKLNVGPVAMVNGSAKLEVGDHVRLELRPDESGKGIPVMCASPVKSRALKAP